MRELSVFIFRREQDRHVPKIAFVGMVVRLHFQYVRGIAQGISHHRESALVDD